MALIVIDPITAYLGHVASHKNAEVRAVLAPLAAMAAEIGVAIVCVSHMNKVGGSDALLWVMGSLGFVAAARGAYLVAKDPEDETRRLFLGRDGRGHSEGRPGRAGVSDKALRRAREKLRIKPRKLDFAGGWRWEIQPSRQDAQDAYIQNVGALGEKGHLGAPSDAESDIEEGSL